MFGLFVCFCLKHKINECHTTCNIGYHGNKSNHHGFGHFYPRAMVKRPTQSIKENSGNFPVIIISEVDVHDGLLQEICSGKNGTLIFRTSLLFRGIFQIQQNRLFYPN